ncbi:MAG: CHASE3 domain-containing protein [Rhodoferax sp.]|nr:CHASE3 domain-containing protein [Rhodoferax sp.]
MFLQSPFSKKLRLLAAALVTLPFLLGAGYALRALGQAEQDAVDTQLIQGLYGTAQAVTQQLEVNAGYLQALAISDAAAKDDMPAMYTQAQRVVQALPQATAVSLVRRDGSIAFLTQRPLGTQGLKTNDPESIQVMFASGKPSVSGPFKAPISERLIVTINVPVVQQGVVVYCLRMVFFPDALNDLLKLQPLPSDWIVAIVESGGKIVARSRKPEQFVGQLATPRLRTVMGNTTPVRFESTTLDGIASSAAVMQLTQWKWSVVVAAPSDKLTGGRYRAMRLLSLFGVAIAVLGALAAYALMQIGRHSAEPPNTPSNHLRELWPSLASLAVALVIVAADTLASQSSLSRIAEVSDARAATSLQRTQLVEVLSLFKDMESGQRGFVMTGRDKFLEPYIQASARLPELLAKLQSGPNATRVEGVNWDTFNRLAEARVKLADQAIAERRETGERVLQDTALFDQGRLTMSKLRYELLGIETLLAQRIDKQTKDLDAERQQASQTQWLATLVTLVLISFSAGFWLNERAQRKKLMAQLIASHAQLEQRVQDRTLLLNSANDQLRTFSNESERTIEAIRKRISREVHDQIGQIFTAIKMIVRTVQPGALAPEQQDALNMALDTGIKTTRRIAAELRPPLLDDLGLRAALDLYLRTSLENSELSYSLDVPQTLDLSSEQMTQMFRIVQEATTNCIKHASAHHLLVSAQQTPLGLDFAIEDDGIGFDPQHVRSGAFGLVSMQERAQMCGGTFRLEQPAHGGTRIAIHIPTPSNPS